MHGVAIHPFRLADTAARHQKIAEFDPHMGTVDQTPPPFPEHGLRLGLPPQLVQGIAPQHPVMPVAAVVRERRLRKLPRQIGCTVENGIADLIECP